MANKTGLMVLPCGDIFVDYKWNTRSAAGTEESSEVDAEGKPVDDGSDENSFAGLVASIEMKGQDTPIVVRPTPKEKTPLNSPMGPHHKAYELVAGFRRYAAIQKLAEKRGDKNPTITANVKVLNNVEAREENIRENSARKNLTAPDTAFGIKALYLAHKKATGKKLTQEELGAMMGISQAYAGRLLGIVQSVPEYAEKWRETPADIKVDDMVKLAKAPADERDDMFAGFINKKGGGGGGGSDDWTTSFRKKGKNAAFLLGILARDGFVTVDDSVFSAEHIDSLVSPNSAKGITAPKKANVGEQALTVAKRQIALDAKTEFNRAKSLALPTAESEEEGEEEEGEEETPKAKAKGKGKKNGATASAN